MSWALSLSLVAGLLFPLWGPTHFLQGGDPDCGPSGLMSHVVQQFEPVYHAPGVEHCVLCHSWRTLGSASTGTTRDVAIPPLTLEAPSASDAGLPARPVVGIRSPRAPPARLARVPQIPV